MSLITTCMVLVVCGLALAAAVTNHTLVRAAELRSVIAQAEAYRGAYLAFAGKYGAAPGDYSLAVGQWGEGTADGNGDGRVLGWQQEEVHAWQHLALSGILPETQTGLDPATLEKPIPGINVPAAYRKGSGYRFTSTAPRHYGKRAGNKLELGSDGTGDILARGALSGADARTLDLKIDDGLADGGNVFALREPGSASCVSGNPTDKAASYLHGSDEVSCRMVFWLE